MNDSDLILERVHRKNSRERVYTCRRIHLMGSAAEQIRERSSGPPYMALDASETMKKILERPS